TLHFSHSCSLANPHLPSFPTRRSSDLSPVLWRCHVIFSSSSDETRHALRIAANITATVRAVPCQFFPKMAFQKGITQHCSLRHRSEEHTSELQSRFDLVCRLLLEKKKT